MIVPEFDTVRIYAESYEYIPIYECIPYEGVSVLDIYAAVRGSYSFLLESGDQTYHGRYSIIALPCDERFVSDNHHTYHIVKDQVEELEGNPLKLLEEMMSAHSPIYPQIPVFTGGAIGHFNYDVIRLQEDLADTLPSLDLPLMQFGFVKELFVIDHQTKLLYILVNIRRDHLEDHYRQAIQRIQEMKEIYENVKHFEIQDEVVKTPLQSNYKQEAFEEMVRKAQQYIHAGDIFQVVLSQRMSCVYTEDPLQAYARLRQTSISPYMYYLDFEDYVIAGVSPELLLQARGSHIRTMPIAGTRKRGKDAYEDQMLMKSLRDDPKENAEHMMLVDLGRNDIGKVARLGSVNVSHLKDIRMYSHVMHMTSEVSGTLDERYSILDALASVLPAGTLSGAPKIRAMEIIEELENVKREVYGGAIGFLGYNKQFDTCITIRTFVFRKGHVYLQAGAGIVKDSHPDKEYQETLQKAAVLLQAIGYEVAL